MSNGNESRKCSVPSCGEKRLARGYCAIHQNQLHEDGHALFRPSMSAPSPSVAEATKAVSNVKIADSTTYTRRAAVAAEEHDMHQPSTSKVVDKDLRIRTILNKAMKDHFLFSNLDDANLKAVIDFMFPIEVKAGDSVIKQGDKGDNFYIVEEGEFDVLVQGKKVHHYTTGASFGDLALMYNAPRAATVTATSGARLWALDRITFRRTMVAASSSRATEIRQFLRSVHLLQPLSEGQMTQLVDAMEEEHFRDGDVIIKQGDAGDKFYILMEGDVAVTQTGKDGRTSELLRLHRGDNFGERALLTNEPRAATVTSVGPCTCLSMKRDLFITMMGPLQELLDRSLSKMVLMCVPLLLSLDAATIEQVLNAMQPQTYQDGQYIIREGEVGSTFYIILEGDVKCYKAGEYLASLHKGDFFGERALMNAEPRAASVVADGKVKVAVLGRKEFQSLKTQMQEIQAKKAEEEKALKARAEAVNVEFTNAHLRRIAILGKGTFGTVWLVEHNQNKETYAMKMMDKHRVISYKQVEHVKKEKTLLKEANHPFLLKLAGAFQDPGALYLVLELVQGGELFSRLQHVGKFDEPTAKFYAGCVILAFEYLHTRSIIYRDLKPENMLIDSDGYAKIVDFGFAKKVTDKTWTLCGTPDYLAPEIINSKGHNKGVDMWAVGVLIHEMLAGYPPFYADDPMHTYQKIMSHSEARPAYKPIKGVSAEAMDIINKLLNPNQSKRYGCLAGGMTDVKTHPWFKGFDWDALYNKKMAAPYIPQIKSKLDTSNFDQYSDDEACQSYTGNDFDDF